MIIAIIMAVIIPIASIAYYHQERAERITGSAGVSISIPEVRSGEIIEEEIEEAIMSVCREIKERIRSIVEEIKDAENNVTRVEELVKELERLREEYKKYEYCGVRPKPHPAAVTPMIAIEAKVKKAQAVEEFLEGMKDLREEMLNNITTQNLTGRQLAEVVKEFNEKRKELVKEFVERIHEINMERIEEIKEVVVSKYVKWENEDFLNVTRITLSVNGKNVTIEPGDTITINVEGIVVSSKIPLKVRNNTIEDAETNQTIRETPDKVREKIREKIKEIKLERKQEIPAYVVSAVKQGRLLGIIPVNVDVNYEISAVDGRTLTISRPWWSFLVFG